MNRTIQSGLAALALAALAGPASAADLGSMKDGYVAPPVYAAPAVTGSSCYFRAAAGYSWSRNPHVNWTGTTFSNEQMDDNWLAEGAVGCGSRGDRGLRAELALTYRGKKKFDADITSTLIPPGDPAHTSVTNYTGMFNAYYDLGNYGGFVPYVGAGVGASYNRMSNVYFTGPTPFFNEVIGANQLSLAWSLMAGMEYKFSQRASLDVGYRYIDMGSVHSDHGDTGNNWNPRFKLDDLTAHELMVGLRYKFCGPAC